MQCLDVSSLLIPEVLSGTPTRDVMMDAEVHSKLIDLGLHCAAVQNISEKQNLRRLLMACTAMLRLDLRQTGVVLNELFDVSSSVEALNDVLHEGVNGGLAAAMEKIEALETKCEELDESVDASTETTNDAASALSQPAKRISLISYLVALRSSSTSGVRIYVKNIIPLLYVWIYIFIFIHICIYIYEYFNIL